MSLEIFLCKSTFLSKKKSQDFQFRVIKTNFYFYLRKLFDPEMVLFNPELMYRFVIERFEGTSSVIQEQALSWLQVDILRINDLIKKKI